MSTIASRVQDAVRASSRTQKQIAASIGMTPDAFSRALREQRNFGALELAELARELGADLHELITGEPESSRFVASARHSYDHETHTRHVTSLEEDTEALDRLEFVYRQLGDVSPTPVLPTSADAMREALGDGFPRRFIERLELLGVDVVRTREILTAWSGSISGRRIIVIPVSGNWFRQNWSIAHELAHHVLGHVGVVPGSPESDRCEADANAFAADLLLPESSVRSIPWPDADPSTVASFLWEAGVSTDALSRRLRKLRITPSPEVEEMLAFSTQRALRRHGRLEHDGPGPDQITQRMNAATEIHFPAWLVSAHVDGIAEGRVGKGSLAWMLGVAPDELELDEPASEPSLSSAELADLLG